MAPEWVVREDEAGLRLDKFLAAPERMGSRGRAASAIERGKVLLNGEDVSPAGAARRLIDGDVVRVWMDRPGSARHEAGADADAVLSIVFEDASLVVVDKPAGVLAVPLDSGGARESSVRGLLERRLRSHGKLRPLVVHRIDRETSGLVVFAKDAETQAALRAQFKRRQPERVYLARVHGCPVPAEGIWRDWLVEDDAACLQRKGRAGDPGAVEAISHYRVIERFEASSLAEVRLETGRRNQIRIQAALRGHMLVGERRYHGDVPARRPIAFHRQALHAWRLSFHHPDGRALRFETPVPRDMADLIGRLRR